MGAGVESLPFEIIYHIFSYLSTAKDLCICCMVCKRWKQALDEDSNDIWSLIFEKTAPLPFRQDELILRLQGDRSKLIAFENSWNKYDCSPNIYLRDNELTLHRNPVSQSTDAIRGKQGYLYGEHYWTITWHRPNFGSNAMIGVATDHEDLQNDGYSGLLGSSVESWGWDISNSVLRYDNKGLKKFPESNIKVCGY